MTIANDQLLVRIDAKGDDDWLECVSVDMNQAGSRLPKDWLVRAHVGITASTGQLADNHDVISLNSFSDAAVLEAHVSDRGRGRGRERSGSLTCNNNLDADDVYTSVLFLFRKNLLRSARTSSLLRTPWTTRIDSCASSKQSMTCWRSTTPWITMLNTV